MFVSIVRPVPNRSMDKLLIEVIITLGPLMMCVQPELSVIC